MAIVLGQDFAQTFGARFSGRLYRGTFTKFTTGAPNPDDPAGPWAKSSDDYGCDLIALSYNERDVDGTIVKKGDYRVVIMRSSIGTTADDAVAATLELASGTIVIAQVPGLLGNAITIEVVGDAVAQAGELDENASEVTLHYLPGVSTVADLEALVASSAIVRVGTPGTPTDVLDDADELAVTRLAGGSDATFTPADVVPNPQDTVLVPPPGESVAKTGRIIDIASITEAAVNLQVRGVSL